MKNTIKLLFLIAVFISFQLSLQGCSKNQNTTGGKTDSAGNTTSSSNNNTGSSSGSSTPEELNSKGFKVDYKISGMMNGNGVVAIKNNKVKTNMKYDMQKMNVSMTVYVDPDWVYTITDAGGMKQNIKTKVKDKTKKDVSELDYSNLKEELKKFKKIGTETILAKVCDIYEVAPGSTVSIYNEMIPLKVKNEAMTMEATAIDLDSGISDSEVTPPADVVFKEVN